ncbi:MAG: B12-binding domain-containing radical SAM protein [Deltaproteobacteria bacterium]|nr:B12-binding domain-containing radical SAM protein [Deltaproteobacteria bacterium]
MKVLLLQPPVRDFYDTAIRLQPLGLSMLKAVVKSRIPDVEVVIKDFHHGHGRRSIPVPAELAYLRDFYRHADSSPFSTFHAYYHFGASFEDIASKVAEEKPDLLGISSLFSPYHREALTCACEIKKRLQVPILMGGSHVSAMPDAVLADPAVDFIIRGEGERPLVELLSALREGRRLEEVPNLGFKRNGDLTLNPMGEPYPFNELPLADLSDLPVGRYLFKGRPLCFVTTSRGCPHSCTFCSVHLTFGKGFRRRSPDGVLAEIRKRYEAGYRVFDFEDDNLSHDRRDFGRLLRLLAAEFRGRDVRFLAMNGISYHSLDRELLVLMKEAGFTHLNLSLVSAEEASLSRVKRPHTLRKYLAVVEDAYSLGFRIVSYQILGLPFEGLETMIDTLALMARLPVLIGVSIFYLTPGSAIAGEFPDLTEGDILRARSTAMAVETDRVKRDDLYTLFITGRILNFLKGLPVAQGKVTLREAIDLAVDLGKRERTGAELLMRLLEEGRLYAATRQGLVPLPHFRPELFFRVLERAGTIGTVKSPFPFIVLRQ